MLMATPNDVIEQQATEKLKPIDYRIGDIVEVVDLDERQGALEAPLPKRWYILQTFPNQEAKVMRKFQDRNISAYHPLVRKILMVRGRKIDRAVPLFATLIFIPDFQVSARGLFVDGVDRFMKFGDYYPVLPDIAEPKKHSDVPIVSRYGRRKSNLVVDMKGIRKLERDSNIPVARRRRLYKIGQLVRVTEGPFAYFNGTIERLDSNGRLNVLLDIFSRGTPVELDEGQIEAA